MCLYISGTNHQTHICFYTFLTKLINNNMFLYISDTKPIKFGFFQGFLAKIIKHIFVHTYTLIYIHTHTYTDIHIQTYFSWGLER